MKQNHPEEQSRESTTVGVLDFGSVRIWRVLASSLRHQLAINLSVGLPFRRTVRRTIEFAVGFGIEYGTGEWTSCGKTDATASGQIFYRAF